MAVHGAVRGAVRRRLPHPDHRVGPLVVLRPGTRRRRPVRRRRARRHLRRPRQLRRGGDGRRVLGRHGTGRALCGVPDPGDDHRGPRPGPAAGLVHRAPPRTVPPRLLPPVRGPRHHRGDDVALPLHARGVALPAVSARGDRPHVAADDPLLDGQHDDVDLHGLQHAHLPQRPAGHPPRPLRGRSPGRRERIPDRDPHQGAARARCRPAGRAAVDHRHDPAVQRAGHPGSRELLDGQGLHADDAHLQHDDGRAVAVGQRSGVGVLAAHGRHRGRARVVYALLQRRKGDA